MEAKSQQISQIHPYRRPEKTVLYQAILKHMNTFFSQMEVSGRWLPSHVEEEFRAFLDCGILAKGFLRLKCSDCNHTKLVAFSCKKRGLCPELWRTSDGRYGRTFGG
jgi:hypothetical protein